MEAWTPGALFLYTNFLEGKCKRAPGSKLTLALQMMRDMILYEP